MSDVRSEYDRSICKFLDMLQELRPDIKSIEDATYEDTADVIEDMAKNISIGSAEQAAVWLNFLIQEKKCLVLKHRIVS